MSNFDSTSVVALERATKHVRDLQTALGLIRATPSDLDNYSIARALNWAMSGRRAPGEAAFEAFCDDELERAGHKHRSAHSVLIPAEVIRRTLQPYQTTVTGSGAELVETTFRGDLFIDALRPRSVALSLGATTVGGLKGDVQIPRLDTASSAYWLTTTGSSPVTSGAITESEGAFDSTPLTVAPSVIAGFGKISRLLLQQTGSSLVNQIIGNDVTRVIATALDGAGLSGSGSGGVPTGITNTSGVNTASGATFAYSTAVSALESITSANGIVNRSAVGWTAPPATASLLAQRVKVTGYPSFIWDGSCDTGSINGHRALASSNVPAATAIVGDWSQLLVLVWGEDGPLEIELNPFSGNFPGGDYQYRAMFSASIVVRHPASFTVVSSIS